MRGTVCPFGTTEHPQPKVEANAEFQVIVLFLALLWQTKSHLLGPFIYISDKLVVSIKTFDPSAQWQAFPYFRNRR